MKIRSLDIVGLHGHYNYNNIVFNSDVTFLYGLNGSGKTTVLNIIESIITGQVYKLFEYNFEKIDLSYGDKTKTVGKIVISFQKVKKVFSVSFNNQKYEMSEIDRTSENSRHEREKKDQVAYFEAFPFLLKIRNTFNYVYLPLNRSSEVDAFNDEEYQWRQNFRYRKIIDRNTRIFYGLSDPMMSRVEDLINGSFNKIYAEINRVSDDFRNEILKSSLDIEVRVKNSSDNQFINELLLHSFDVKNIKRTQMSYIKLLKDLSLLDSQEESRINTFFQTLVEKFDKETDRISHETSYKLQDLIGLYEAKKASSLVDIANMAEKKKSAARKPIDTFLETVNSFLDNDSDGKMVLIDDSGLVYFKTKYSDKPIRIHNLSSGEKQLVNFYANLIFRSREKSSGIFVVDEPELSLHLFWQKRFVDKALELNNSIQLIFATHSPEFVGRHKDKMVYLMKEYVD